MFGGRASIDRKPLLLDEQIVERWAEASGLASGLDLLVRRRGVTPRLRTEVAASPSRHERLFGEDEEARFAEQVVPDV